MRLKRVGVLLALGFLYAASPASAVPIGGWDDIEIGDTVEVDILNNPKAYRLQEKSINPGGAPNAGPLHLGGSDPRADWITYCVDTAISTGDGLTYLITGFTRPASFLTAYLYTQYREGFIPPGYSNPLPPLHTHEGPLSPKRPDAMQETIYFFEGQNPGQAGVNTAFVADANCKVYGIGPGCAGATSWAGGGYPAGQTFGDVWIIHMVRTGSLVGAENGEPGQPFLVMLDPAIPEPGSLILLGSGLVGLATAARRRRAARRSKD